MPRSGDAHPQLRQKVDWLGAGHDLRFDPGRSEQQVHDRHAWFGGECESGGREPPDSLLLDDRLDEVATSTQTVDEGFSLPIGGHGHRQIRISRKPGLGSDRDGETTHERERDVCSREFGADPAKGRVERGHPSLALISTGRPGQSPNSAPGRS